MSFALKFADRALADFQRLDPWLQEDALDELEIIAANPSMLHERLRGAPVHDFVRDRDDKRYYVFLTVRPLASSQLLQVKEIGFWIKQLSENEK